MQEANHQDHAWQHRVVSRRAAIRSGWLALIGCALPMGARASKRSTHPDARTAEHVVEAPRREVLGGAAEEGYRIRYVKQWNCDAEF